jgi:hypothetical protein
VMCCGSSKEDTKNDTMVGCWEKKHLLRVAMQVHHAMARANMGYATALRNVGAALSDYAETCKRVS